MTKVITRHVWQEYLDMAEHFRLSLGMRDAYRKRKETIERVFADAKEKHGMRYTHYRGMAKLKFEIGLTFAAMNLKKLALWAHKPSSPSIFRRLFHIYEVFYATNPIQAAA